MADALLSKEHFYVNASYFNDTDVDQEAVIHVQDNSDILNRSDDWLVHITRFSCDSMQSLPYIVKDDTAKWEITIFDWQNHPVRSFNFQVDRDFYTPQALLTEMNMNGRTLTLPSFSTTRTTTNTTVQLEMFRWQIDADGRFRLVSQPEKQGMGYYIAYAATPSMNNLLGFERVSAYTRFQPNAVARFIRAIEFLHEKCPEVATAKNIYDGKFHTQINELLVHLLAGAELYEIHNNGNDPQTDVPDMTTDLGMNMARNRRDLTVMGVAFKERVPVTNHRDGEPLFQRNESPCWMEWYDMPFAHHVVDRGHRAGIFQLYWYDEYTSTATARTEGRVKFKDQGDFANAAAAPFITVPFPTYHPANGRYTSTRYAYPANSLPGYYIGGKYTGGAYQEDDIEGELAIAARFHLRSYTIQNSAGGRVRPGDDMWVPIPEVGHHATQSKHAETFQVSEVFTSITHAMPTDTMGIHVSDPLSLNLESVGYSPPQNIMFTDRRVPFQSRSTTYTFESTAQAPGFEFDTADGRTTLFSQFWSTNVEVGDTLYWILDGIWQPHGYEIVDHYVAPAFSTTSWLQYIFDVADGDIPIPIALQLHTATKYEIFIHKKNGDQVRWDTDAANMRMAANTFTYQYDKWTQPTGLELQPPMSANGINYASRHLQTFDEALLGEQVDSFVKALRTKTIFHNVSSPIHCTGSAIVREKIDDATFEALPAAAEIVRPTGTTHEFADLGADQLVLTGNTVPIVLGLYGRGNFPDEITDRFPHGWWTVIAHEPNPELHNIVKRLDYDYPWLMVSPTGILPTNTDLVIQGTLNGQALEASPLICGVQESTESIETYIIWATASGPGMGPGWASIDANSLSTQVSKLKGKAAIVYGSTTQGFNIVRKELSSAIISDDAPHRLFGYDGDYIASRYSSHIDLMFPWRQLIITSEDLQQLPEKSQDAASRQPILSSYTLSTLGTTSVDKNGKPAGGVSQPFGTVYFSESGTRRYHHLLKLPGALRSFRLSASLTYKDNSKIPVKVKLMPGGQFVAQLLFMRKMEET